MLLFCCFVFVGEKNDYYTLFIVLLFFEFCIIPQVVHNYALSTSIQTYL
ncbi:hypothetical protein [uncultured Gammaproteobacteria bacterium]|nr:hypothetical protein [uncultured Gammaproteobacteria bacterium]